MHERKSFFKAVPLIQAIIYTLIITVVSSAYLIVLTRSVKLTIPLVAISVGVFLYVVYLKQREKNESNTLKELQLYALTMIYHMERGENVLRALDRTRESIDSKEIRKDIEVTMRGLNSSTPELNTEHFLKYKFEALDIFHHLLLIKYEKGGNTKEVFKNTNQYINMEIEQREKLRGELGTVKTILVVMFYMALSIPLLFGLRAVTFYDMFMEHGLIANITNGFYYVLLMISYVFIARSASNLNLAKY